MTHPSLISDQLSELSLSQAEKEYRRQITDAGCSVLSFEDRLELMLNVEISGRLQRRIERRIKEANLRIRAVPEEIDKKSTRGLPESLLSQILGLGWLRNHHHILVTGPTGVGKTYLACALGLAAIRNNATVRYFKCSTLIERIGTARLDGSYRSFVSKLSHIDVMIIDDWGLSPITVNGARELLDIIDDRVGTSSLVIASQLPLSSWYQTMEEGTVADAVLDRVVHNSIKVELSGESMRKVTSVNQPISSVAELTDEVKS
jgi:DNA replication protein DnaC